MKIITWNVNGLRALLKKENILSDLINDIAPDILCLQETKINERLEIPCLSQYEAFHNFSKTKKGYSGTSTFIKVKSESISFDTDVLPKKYSDEGRLVIIEHKDFYLINEYTPNYGRELETDGRNTHKPERVGFRMGWEDERRKLLMSLDKKKPVILCGDLNVAHNEIDLKNDKTNHNSAGFTDGEREKMTKLLSSGFVDVFREKYPQAEEYTWWSYRFNAREKNTGWRIDYFVISKNFLKKIKDIKILKDVYGSDHCPVMLTF